MIHESLGDDQVDVIRLGEPVRVFQVSLVTRRWAYLITLLPCFLALVVLIVSINHYHETEAGDPVGLLIFLTVVGLLLWGASALWKQALRTSRRQVVVYTGGLSYHDGQQCHRCLWEQVITVKYSGAGQYELDRVPLSGADGLRPTTVFLTERLVVRRMNGPLLVFTGEIENIADLAGIIHLRLSLGAGGVAGTTSTAPVDWCGPVITVLPVEAPGYYSVTETAGGRESPLPPDGLGGDNPPPAPSGTTRA